MFPRLISVLPLVVLFLAAPARAVVPDFTDRIELLGNPLTARWGTGDASGKIVNHLKLYDGRIFIGSGSTSTNARIDLWSFPLDTQEFLYEQLINQETVAEFREFDGKLYINNEDLGDTGANVTIYDGETWRRSAFLAVALHPRSHPTGETRHATQAW